MHTPHRRHGSQPLVLTRVTHDRPGTPWGLVVLWLFTALIGAILGIIGFVGVVDPVGSKGSDDGDPFGPTGGRVYPAVMMLTGMALVFWPVVPRARRRHPTHLHPEDARGDHRG